MISANKFCSPAMAHSAGVYLGDFEVDFETNLGYESEGQRWVLFFIKKRRSVI
jgi:hypothetical protein